MKITKVKKRKDCRRSVEDNAKDSTSTHRDKIPQATSPTVTQCANK